MFMEAQGYAVNKNVLFQDNQSMIRMEVNGRNSGTGNLKHINMRYFFMKDKLDEQGMEVH